MESQIKYVRDNFFAGEEFKDREHAQRVALTWCRTTAGLRLHGTTRKRPLLVFEEEEQKTLLHLSAERFDVPAWAECKSIVINMSASRTPSTPCQPVM